MGNGCRDGCPDIRDAGRGGCLKVDALSADSFEPLLSLSVVRFVFFACFVGTNVTQLWFDFSFCVTTFRLWLSRSTCVIDGSRTVCNGETSGLCFVIVVVREGISRASGSQSVGVASSTDTLQPRKVCPLSVAMAR